MDLTLVTLLQTKPTKNNPNQPEHWRNGQGWFGGCGALREQQKGRSPLQCPDSVRGHEPPPVTPQLFTSARPTDNSQQEMGEAGCAKARGCRGRGGCGSKDQVALVGRENDRCKSKQKKTPNHPEPRNGERRKRGKGNPTKTERRIDKNVWGPRLVEGGQQEEKKQK